MENTPGLFISLTLLLVISQLECSISYSGLVIDRPKLRVLSYRVKHSNPNAITEELSCTGGGPIGGTVKDEGLSFKNCDNLIELDENDPSSRLGLDDGENAEWSIPPNVTNLVIECLSKSGPVEWDYQGKGSFPDIDIETRRTVGDFWSPTTYTHISELTFNKVDDQLTGTFVCRNIEKLSVFNSFYMFVPQENRPIFKVHDGSLTIISPSHEETVIIPCRLKDREKSIYLYKKLENGSLKRMNMEPGLNFNPYQGFQLEVSPDVYGHYICKTDKTKEESESGEIFTSKSNSRRKRDSISSSTNVETSTSPGFSAFPTSEELTGFLTPEGYQMPLVSPDQVSITYPEIEQDPRPRWRRKKHPANNNLRTRVNNMLSRRGGQYHSGHYPPPNHNIRPVFGLGPFFRRRKPPHPFQFSPLPSHHHHLLPSRSQAVVAVPMTVIHEDSIESVAETSSSDSPNDKETKQSHRDYFYPPLPSDSSTFSSIPSKTILPTFITKSGVSKMRPHIRPFASSSEEISYSPMDADSSTNFMPQPQDSHETDVYPKYSKRNNQTKKPPRRGAAAVLSQNLLPQTMNIMNSMSCVLKKVMLGPEASCNSSFFDAGTAAAAAAAISRRPGQGHNYLSTLKGNRPEDQVTILEVDVQPAPVNKFFPSESTIYTTVPFFVKWQTRSTDFSNWAEVNHTLRQGTFKLHKAGHLEDHGIHSFEVFNMHEGESGRISVPYVGSNNSILHHTWKFFIINGTTFSDKGLKQQKDGSKIIFTCKSATVNKPKIILVKLSDDGCPIEKGDGKKRKFSKKKSVEEDCGVGCAGVRTDVENGIVHCFGDGVDETIRFPSDVYCTGRPFFVERTKTKNLTLSENKMHLTIPCVINNPNADVYLYHQDLNGTITDVTDSTTYDIKMGFQLKLDKMPEPLGTYVCTSTTNLDDDSDAVTYHVNSAPAHIFNPPSEQVMGSPPFRFVWESKEELEVENKSMGNFYSGVFAKPEGNRPFVGTFEITNLERGQSGVVKVIKSKNKEVVHTWRYSYQGKYGLWVDRKLNIFKCKYSSGDLEQENMRSPSLFAVECSNPNVCRLKRRFVQDEDPNRDNVECGDGCTELKVWKNKPYGFAKCKDNSGKGMEDSMNYFLSRNSTLLTETDNLDDFRALEITSVVRNLRLGETINFRCKANKYFYSKGFQWAIEMKDGTKRFLESGIGRDSDAYLNELKSEISLKVEDKGWKAVWCFAPLIDYNQWGNASQLVYIQ